MKKYIAKTTACLLTVCLIIVNFPVFSAAGIFRGSADTFEYLANDNFSSYGSITDVSYVPGAPVFVVINDLHGDFAAQSNIDNMIEYFKNKAKIENLIVEGAPAGKNSLKLFETIPVKIRENILRTLLNSGELSGAEYFAAHNNFTNIYGLEKWDLYLKNIRNAETLKNKYKNEAKLLKKYFTKTFFVRENNLGELYEVFFDDENLQSKILKTADFCAKYDIDLSRYKDLYYAVNYYAYKQNGYAVKELKAVLADASKKLPYTLYVNMVNALKKGDTSLFYVLLKKYCPQLLLKYEKLAEYLSYEDSVSSVRGDYVIEQLDILKNEVLNKYASAEQKEAVNFYGLISLLDEYAGLSITYDNYLRLNLHKNRLCELAFKYFEQDDAETVCNIINDRLLQEYYSVNVERNKIFYENVSSLYGQTVRVAKNVKSNDRQLFFQDLKNDLPLNIIVVGGFHRGFCEMLKNDNVTVVSVFPKTKYDGYYKQALAPPLKIASKEPVYLASVINEWLKQMKGVVDLNVQRETVKKWLEENSIDEDFSFDEKDIPYFADVPLSELVAEVSRKESYTTTQDVSAKKTSRIIRKIIPYVLKPAGFLSKAAPVASDYFSNTILEQNVLKNEYAKTLDSLKGDMPDVIVFTVQDDGDSDFCREILTELKKYKKFAAVRIEFVKKTINGTGGSFIEAVKCIEKTAAESGKSKQDLKSLVIDIDHERKNILNSLKIPLSFGTRNIMPLELAVLNGIRSIQNFKSGGIAVIDPQTVYVGDMRSAGDITFITSFVNMKEIENREMSLVIADHPDRLEQIYYGFNPDSISDVVEKKGLERKGFYNFDNKSMRQFEVITGNILINFKDGSRYSEFFNLIEQLGDYLDSANYDINLIGHIFIPFLRAKNGQNILSYLAKVRNKEGIETERSFFRNFGLIFNSESHPVLKSAGLSVYHQPKSFFSNDFQNRTFRVLKKVSRMTSDEKYDPSVSKIKNNRKISVGQKPASDNAVAAGYELLRKITDNEFSYEQNYEMIIEMARTTAFQRQIYTNSREDAARLYRQAAEIIGNIIISIDRDIMLQRYDAEYLRNIKNMYLFLQNYCIEYLQTIDFAANVSIFGSYVFPETSLFEKTKIMPLNRKAFGFDSGFRRAKRDLRKQIVSLYLSGNFLIDSLYSFPVMKKDIEAFINEHEEPKQKTYVGMQKQWQDREALTKILSLVTAVQAFATALIAEMFLGGIGGLGATIAALASGIGLSIFLHVFFKNTGWINLFYYSKKREIIKALNGQTNMVKAIELFSKNEKMFFNLKKIMKKIAKNKNSGDSAHEKAARNLELIEQYEHDYDFFVIKEIKTNSFDIISEINDENIKKQIREIFTYFEQMRFSDPEKYDGLGYGFESEDSLMHENTRRHLENWMKLNQRKHFDKNSIDAVIFNAMQIIRLTSFSADVVNEENKNKIVLELQDFISFYQETIEKITGLSPEEQSGLEYEISVLNEAGRYAVMYYDAVSNMFNVDILSGYRVSKGNVFYFLEIVKIMAAVRVVFGIESGILLSSKRLKKSMKEVKETGNSLIPGLYSDNFDSDVENYLYKKSHPEYFHLGISESWKVRDMLVRLFPLVFFASSMAHSILSGGVSWEQILFSFIKGIGLSIALHWLPILYGYFKTGITTGKLIGTIKQTFGLKTKEGININKQKLLKKQVERLAKVPEGQMPDLTIMAGSSEFYNAENMRDSIASITRFGNLSKMKTAYVVSDGYGSGNSILSVYEYLRSENFKNDYPELAGKPVSELKIAVINMDSSHPDDITSEFDIKILNNRTNAAELALLNAISLMQNSKKETGNMVIVNPRYMYLGDLTAPGNITLLGSKVSYGQMQKQNLPLMISAHSDSYADAGQLRKIYSRYSDDKMTNIVVKNMLRKTYNLNDKTTEQMPTFSGIMSLSFDDPEKFRHIERILVAAGQYQLNYDGKKFPVDMMNHLLIPILMLINGEDIFVYLETFQIDPKMPKEDKAAYDRFFYGLFKKIEDVYKTNKVLGREDIVITPGLNSQMSIVQPFGQEYKSFIRFLQLLTDWGEPVKVLNPVSENTDGVLYRKSDGKKNQFVFIAQGLTMAVKQHIRAFDNKEADVITIVPCGSLSAPKNTGLIVNVTVDGAEIPAKAVYEIFADAYGSRHILISFEPVAVMHETDGKESEIIMDLRYGDGSSLRQKIFLARASLSFIKKLQTLGNASGLEQNGLRFLKDFKPSFIFSFDNAGVFSKPELFEDEFFNDKELAQIKHVGIKVSENDASAVKTGEIKFSRLFKNYEFGAEIDLEDLEKIVSDYGVNGQEINSKILFSDVKSYYNLFMKNLNGGLSDSSEKEFSTELKDTEIIPTVKLSKFADIYHYIEFFGRGIFKSVILKDVYYDDGIFNFGKVSISREIDRLKNPNMNKLKFLINESKSGNDFDLNDPAYVFVLEQMLSYIRDNAEENEKLVNFIESRDSDFMNKMQLYTASVIAGDKIKTVESADQIKYQDPAGWNKYHSLSIYMQYIAYIQFAELEHYLALNNIRPYLSDDILKENNIPTADFASISLENLKEKLKDAAIINIDITGVFERIGVLETFKEIASLKQLVIAENDSYKSGVKDAQKFEEMILGYGISNKIDISWLENADGATIFDRAEQIFYEADTADGEYQALLFYISKLKTAYKFSNQRQKEETILRLKGFLNAVYEMQVLSGFDSVPYMPDTEIIEAMLASA